MINSAQIVSISEDMQPPIEQTEYVWFRVNVMKKPNSDIDIDDSEVLKRNLLVFLPLILLVSFSLQVFLFLD